MRLIVWTLPCYFAIGIISAPLSGPRFIALMATAIAISVISAAVKWRQA